MQRRDMLAGMGLGTAAFALGGVASAQQQQQPQRGGGEGHAHGHSEHLAVMVRCAEACARAASHCLDQLRQASGDAEKHANALQHAAACEEFCILSAKQSACNSPLAHLAHEANAQACDECARACEGFEDQVMKDCVQQCRECSEACRQMVQAGQGDQGNRRR